MWELRSVVNDMAAMYRMVANHTLRWLFNGAYRARMKARHGSGLLSWRRKVRGLRKPTSVLAGKARFFAESPAICGAAWRARLD